MVYIPKKFVEQLQQMHRFFEEGRTSWVEVLMEIRIFIKQRKTSRFYLYMLLVFLFF